jgi:hypothetical protein
MRHLRNSGDHGIATIMKAFFLAKDPCRRGAPSLRDHGLTMASTVDHRHVAPAWSGFLLLSGVTGFLDLFLLLSSGFRPAPLHRPVIYANDVSYRSRWRGRQVPPKWLAWPTGSAGVVGVPTGLQRSCWRSRQDPAEWLAWPTGSAGVVGVPIGLQRSGWGSRQVPGRWRRRRLQRSGWRADGVQRSGWRSRRGLLLGGSTGGAAGGSGSGLERRGLVAGAGRRGGAAMIGGWES